MFAMDATKDHLSNIIKRQQLNLNHSTSERHKILNQSDLFNPGESGGPQRSLNRGLADIQKEQMELKRIDAANDLIKSRIQDEENLISNHQRFPYGKENVIVSEDVLERYKANYI